jgi:predicted nucleotidyltransferase
MNFHELASAIAIPAPVRDEIDQLLEAKARASELGLAPRNVVIEGFVQAQLDWAGTAILSTPKNDLRAEAETLFREIVRSAA